MLEVMNAPAHKFQYWLTLIIFIIDYLQVATLPMEGEEREKRGEKTARAVNAMLVSMVERWDTVGEYGRNVFFYLTITWRRN